MDEYKHFRKTGREEREVELHLMLKRNLSA